MLILIKYTTIFATIVFTVYGQLILKWRIANYGPLLETTVEKIKFLSFLFFAPFILSSFIAAILASLAWTITMTKLDLGQAYSFMSLNFVLVMILSAWLLYEPITLPKVERVALIMAGTFVIARG
ncbi:DMT family transporter [Legionella fallonii]|uniref:EamA-like transporter family n=1 Tax=Legionella fallonii LLAP-10 TaxID=1212491 RepID=A0A098G8N3_9GAMM|nr:hypothetical protein [Legionella fallonii]CEG58349.1 EamA-like transporter family [Legionella fallonii LLAP-10]